MLRILIVEDEPLIRLEIQGVAEEAGHEVVGSAATGADAIRIAEEQQPDVILMDISLVGEMDGIEAARSIRELWGIRSLFVSAFRDDLRDKADSARPFGFLLKPIARTQLVEALEEIAWQLRKSG